MMTLQTVISALQEVHRLHGDIPLWVMTEDENDRKNSGMLAEKFLDTFTHVELGKGRVAILRVT